MLATVSIHYTLDTMEWGILPVTEDEPDTTIDTTQGKCIMPTCERWHCSLTTTEMVTSPDLHILDWQPYQKSWGDEYLSMRHIEENPPESALRLSEWLGTKIWQVATIPPSHPSQETGETQEPKKWRYSQSGFNYLSEEGTREEDRSRTPLHTRVSVMMILKERVRVKRERSQLRSFLLLRERRLRDLVRSTFLVQQLFRNPGEIRNLRNLLCQVQLIRIRDEPLWCSSRVQMGFQSLDDHGWFLMLPLGEIGFLTTRQEIPGYGIPQTKNSGQCVSMSYLQRMHLSAT